MTKVLICDDSMFARQMTGRMATEAGYEVIGEAQDGEEAVAMYRELKPQALLVDLIMPRCGGIDAIRRIVAEDPDARILVCSAMGQEKMVQEALSAGARGFVLKPAKAQAIQAALGDALR